MTDVGEPIERVCVSCGERFIIEVTEQRFFASLAQNDPDATIALPRRCKACRFRRRYEHTEEA
jgi:hypothetical protein